MTIYLNNHSDRQCMRTLIPPHLTNKSLGCWLSTSLSWRYLRFFQTSVGY